MKQYIVLVIIIFAFVSCNNEEASKASSVPVTKVKVVDADCQKVEVILNDGNVVMFQSETSMKKLAGSKQLDHVTIYRTITDDADSKELWKVDNQLPLVKIDTTILCIYDGDKLRKLEYRQGYISVIYK